MVLTYLTFQSRKKTTWVKISTFNHKRPLKITTPKGPSENFKEVSGDISVSTIRAKNRFVALNSKIIHLIKPKYGIKTQIQL